MKNTLLIFCASMIIIFPIPEGHGVLPFILSPLIVKSAIISIIPFVVLLLVFVVKKWRDTLNMISALLLTGLFWLCYTEIGMKGTGAGFISIGSSFILHFVLLYLGVKNILRLVKGKT